MPNDWIIDVLTDLKAFAGKNGLPVLADELDDAILVAMTEIASADTQGQGTRLVGWEVEHSGKPCRRVAAR